MANNIFTPATIDGTFSIPLYQRLFSWKEENVKKLLSDLKEHFENEKKENWTGKETKPYYLGMLTCKGKELIDGQQRMTVMTLMGIVLKKFNPCWKKFLLNDKDEQRIEFTARSDDQGYIQKMIEKGTIVNSEGYVNNNMKSALETIYRFMKDSFNDDNERKIFAENVYEHLTFFIAELPINYGNNEYLLNKYFEAMNSAGRNLEQHEILKVELLKGMENQDRLTKIWNAVSRMDKILLVQEDNESMDDYRKRFRKAIKDGDIIKNIKLDEKQSTETIENINAEKIDFNNVVLTSGTDAIISFEEFLLMVLDITKNKESNPEKITIFYQKEKLLERFKDLINSTPAEREAFYNNLLLYRLLMDYYVIRREFNAGEVKQYSLLVKDENDEEKGMAKLLSQYQSMLHVSTEFYNWLKPYLLKVKEDGSSMTTVNMLEYLKSQDNLRHKSLPDDMSFNSVDRYWFWRLDYYLWENRKKWYEKCDKAQKEAVDDFIFRANRSVEHFYPQDQNQQERPWDNNIIDINSFGNLALISVSFNSQQNNDHLRLKMARIESHIALRKLQSLKLLRMYLDAKNGNDDWTEAKAENHQNEMLQILRESYE